MSETLLERSPTIHEHDRGIRFYDNQTTWLAEVLKGQMLTEFEYTWDGEDLRGRDGGSMTKIFQDSLAHAEVLARTNPNLAFELRRRKHEDDERVDMQYMAQGLLPNTMVIESDFPSELMHAPKSIGGYDVERKQTMLRIVTKNSEGILHMSSQTLDKSDRASLEAIYYELGFEPQPGELLGQRMHLELTPDQQATLRSRLVGVYDRTLSAQYGGEWYAGRSPAEMTNTYDFVRQQSDLLDAYASIVRLGKATEDSLYNLATAMQARFDKHKTGESVYADKSITAVLLEMQGAGNKARIKGEVVNGCGLTLEGTKKDLKDAGYGNQTDEETKYEFDKEAYCVVCQPAPKANEEMKMCGPCDICKDCDTKIRAKEEAKKVAWLN